MLGNRTEIAVDILVVVAALLKILGGLDRPHKADRPDRRRYPEVEYDRPVSPTWELRRLPPVEFRNVPR